MQERTISIGTVAAVTLWVLTLIFVLLGTAFAFSVGHKTQGLAAALTLMTTGLSCSAAAATATIRCMLHAQNRLMREAFQLGQEASHLRRVGG